MSKFSKGDTVILVEPSYSRGPATVTTTTVVKEGTKYVYIESDWRIKDTPFDKETGHQKKNPKSNNHYNATIWVPVEYEARELRSKTIESLREKGIRFERNYMLGDPGDNYSIDALQRILLALDYDIDKKWRQSLGLLHNTDDWVIYWKSLDHSNCGKYGAGDTVEEIQANFERPDYQQCRSMHCPDCGKTTGSQGHRNCPERKTS